MAANYWKLMHETCCTTDEKIAWLTQSVYMSICLNCKRDKESLNHLLWDCAFAQRAYDWIEDVFNIKPDECLIQTWKNSEGRSMLIRELWLSANITVRVELWNKRNAMKYDGRLVHWIKFKARIFSIIANNSIRMKSCMYNTLEDKKIVEFFGVQSRFSQLNDPIECEWLPPEKEELLICCDGATSGNPGPSGAGVVARNSAAEVLGALSVGLGDKTNFLAEVYAVVYGLEWARRWDCAKIRVRSDSAGVMNCFSKNSVPWFLLDRWEAMRRHYNEINFEHAYREINFAADTMAKRAKAIPEGQKEEFIGRPDFLTDVEWPGHIYYRF